MKKEKKNVSTCGCFGLLVLLGAITWMVFRALPDGGPQVASLPRAPAKPPRPIADPGFPESRFIKVSGFTSTDHAFATYYVEHPNQTAIRAFCAEQRERCGMGQGLHVYFFDSRPHTPDISQGVYLPESSGPHEVGRYFWNPFYPGGGVEQLDFSKQVQRSRVPPPAVAGKMEYGETYRATNTADLYRHANDDAPASQLRENATFEFLGRAGKEPAVWYRLATPSGEFWIREADL